jgi:hypothetical protein
MRTDDRIYTSETRNTAYGDVLDKLAGQRRQVFECIVEYAPISNNVISEILGIPVHVVCARVNELRGYEKNPLTMKREVNPKKQFVEYAGKDNTVKPAVSLWRPAAKQPELNFN